MIQTLEINRRGNAILTGNVQAVLLDVLTLTVLVTLALQELTLTVQAKPVIQVLYAKI